MLTVMTNLTVEQHESGLSCLSFLRQRIPAAPKGFLHQLLKKGRINQLRIGQEKQTLHDSDMLQPGDQILLPDSARLESLLKDSGGGHGVAVLFESDHTLIVAKPSGLAVHAGVGHSDNNLASRVAAYLAGTGQHFVSAPVHRLDSETSGPVIFGKGKRACSELGKLFMAGSISKRYLALVRGALRHNGNIDSIIPAKGKLKRATASYRSITAVPSASLVEIVLQTGRQHQIRRQFADDGHPLYGDRRYRGPCPPTLERLFLHCHRLDFDEPFDGQRISIYSPLPEELLTFCISLGLSTPKIISGRDSDGE